MNEHRKLPRRRHSAQFKREVLAACNEPGASFAGVALAFGLNAVSGHRAPALQAAPLHRHHLQPRSAGLGKYLGDAIMATTILDRLMHRCAMLEFEGKSYRLKKAATHSAVTSESS